MRYVYLASSKDISGNTGRNFELYIIDTLFRRSDWRIYCFIVLHFRRPTVCRLVSTRLYKDTFKSRVEFLDWRISFILSSCSLYVSLSKDLTKAYDK